MKPAHNKEVLEEPVQGEHRGLGIKESPTPEQAGSIIGMSKTERGEWHGQASNPAHVASRGCHDGPGDTGPGATLRGDRCRPEGVAWPWGTAQG